MARADQGAAHNLESSEGQGAHPRTPSQSDAAARPEATLPGPESVATNERGDLPIGFCHRMGEHQAHSYEYMDATYWCRGVGQKPDAATDRVFGHHEAEAMFEAIGNALAVLERGGETCGRFLRELRGERELLVTDRLWLARLYDAVQSENFNRTGKGEMSANLRATLKGARDALDAS